jgi:DNA polymerase
MDEAVHEQVLNYFKQQAELGTPDYIFPIIKETNDHRYSSASEDSAEKTAVNEDRKDLYNGKRSALVELYHEVKDCRGCGLSTSRHKLVFGGGKASAPLMIIGEAPGYEEDRQGKPFVGRAGALLTKMLAAINLNREKDVFITNILKCRPPENRNPNQTEAIACMPILNRQIRIIDPKAILALGRIAAHELLNKTESIGKLRAETHNYNEIPVIVTYHPAALLRNERYKRPAWEDLQRLQQILREKGVYGNS